MEDLRWLATVWLLIALIVFSTSCNKAPTQPASQSSSTAKRYHLKGKVVSIDQQSRMANIDSEAIPDFMDAMTMPYTVKPEGGLDKLKPGDAITADVVVQDEKAWLENIVVAGSAASEKK
jgi:protein SCO1/2